MSHPGPRKVFSNDPVERLVQAREDMERFQQEKKTTKKYNENPSNVLEVRNLKAIEDDLKEATRKFETFKSSLETEKKAAKKQSEDAKKVMEKLKSAVSYGSAAEGQVEQYKNAERMLQSLKSQIERIDAALKGKPLPIVTAHSVAQQRVEPLRPPSPPQVSQSPRARSESTSSERRSSSSDDYDAEGYLSKIAPDVYGKKPRK